MAQKTGDQDTAESFKAEFLKHYLSFGIGALGKKDIDVLVMHLLDKYGVGGGPLRSYPNQAVSGILKAPAAKIKLLRYEAGLKYGGRVEDQAKSKLLHALSHAVIEVETKKICLIIEDALAKNWLQGELKNNGLIFDHSFNTEIVKLDSKGLFSVLMQFFDAQETERFKASFERLEKEKKTRNCVRVLSNWLRTLLASWQRRLEEQFLRALECRLAEASFSSSLALCRPFFQRNGPDLAGATGIAISFEAGESVQEFLSERSPGRLFPPRFDPSPSPA